MKHGASWGEAKIVVSDRYDPETAAGRLALMVLVLMILGALLVAVTSPYVFKAERETRGSGDVAVYNMSPSDVRDVVPQ